MNPSGYLLHAAWAALALITAGLGGCDGGTSSETVGVVVARAGIDGITGRTDAGNIVGLYSEGFLPHLDSGYAKRAVADSDGAFAFADLEPGRYRVLARRPSDGKAALLPELSVPTEAGTVRRADLEPTGTLDGTITDSLPSLLGLVYMPGTPFHAVGDTLMRYSISGLPAGDYTVVKSWRKPLACEGPAPCSGLDTRKDSANVRILPGGNAVW